jgi:hypothetical protein
VRKHCKKGAFILQREVKFRVNGLLDYLAYAQLYIAAKLETYKNESLNEAGTVLCVNVSAEPQSSDFYNNSRCTGTGS